MLVVCPGCGARYQIAADRMPAQGARARCPKCERVFRVGLPSDTASDSRRANLRPAGLPGNAAPRAHAPPRPVLKPSPPNTEAVLPPPPIPLARPTSTPDLTMGIGNEMPPRPFNPRSPSARPAIPFAPAQRPPIGVSPTQRPPLVLSPNVMPPEPRPLPESAAASAEGAPPEPYSTLDVAPVRREAIATRIRIGKSPVERPLLISHGYGLGDTPAGTEPPDSTMADAMLELSAADMRQIAEDLVMAICGNHAEKVALARADQRWDAHLGRPIREAWGDYQAVVGSRPDSGEHFRNALNSILADGRAVF
jgi:predicted Zn finger-like uncharacterized protein